MKPTNYDDDFFDDEKVPTTDSGEPVTYNQDESFYLVFSTSFSNEGEMHSKFYSCFKYLIDSIGGSIEPICDNDYYKYIYIPNSLNSNIQKGLVVVPFIKNERYYTKQTLYKDARNIINSNKSKFLLFIINNNGNSLDTFLFDNQNDFNNKEREKKYTTEFEQLYELLNCSFYAVGNVKKQFKSIYIKEQLFLGNIDSDYTFSVEDMSYIEDTYSSCIPQQFKSSPLGNILFKLKITNPPKVALIPIFLKKDMPSYSYIWKKIEGKDKDKFIPQTKVLGYYTEDDEDFCKGPHIVISPENIMEEVSEHISFKTLFAQVLIHEFAHAQMAPAFPKTLEAKAMEESLANMITLQCFKKYGKDFETVKNCIRKQPIIYQFGINQFDIDADWTKWRDSDKNQPELKTWFETCFKTDGTVGIRDDLVYTKEIYNAVFK